MRKIFSLTGTRADYGLMRPVFQMIHQSQNFELSLLITGMHLLSRFHISLQEIKEDSLGKHYHDSLLREVKNEPSMAEILAYTVITVSNLLRKIQPDIVLLQGDRGEMLAGAIAAAHMNIPLVHMSGGDVTGSIDDSIRQAITAFSNIHLTTCESSSRNLLKYRISRRRIFQVGEPGLDAIRVLDIDHASDLAKELELDIKKPIILATLHPVTTEAAAAGYQMDVMLGALEKLQLQTILTHPNSDYGSTDMLDSLSRFSGKSWLKIFPTMGSKKYLELLGISTVVVGNSSSGIIEAPSFKKPVVNIGSRQEGRLKAKNVIDVDFVEQEIIDSIHRAIYDEGFKNELNSCINPYGDGWAALKTLKILDSLDLSSPELISNKTPKKELVPRGWDAL